MNDILGKSDTRLLLNYHREDAHWAFYSEDLVLASHLDARSSFQHDRYLFLVYHTLSPIVLSLRIPVDWSPLIFVNVYVRLCPRLENRFLASHHDGRSSLQCERHVLLSVILFHHLFSLLELESCCWKRKSRRSWETSVFESSSHLWSCVFFFLYLLDGSSIGGLSVV